MSARRPIRSLAAFVAVAACLVSSVASADPASADALFREGRRLLEEGKTDEACLKFAESQTQDPSSGTLLNLGFCHELQHKLASAWSEYASAAQLARDQGKEDRAAVAEEKAKAIAPRVPYLTVTVMAPVPGLRISRGAQTLGLELLGRAVPVDPGNYVIVASAPGRREWKTAVDITESESKTVTVPELDLETPSPAELPKQQEPKPTPIAPAPQRNVEAQATGANPWGWVVGGAGIAALAVGAGFGASSLSSYHDANTSCPSHQDCTDAAISARSSAETKAWVANIAIGVGVIGVAAGSWILLSGRGEPATRMAIVTAPNIAGMRVSLEQSF